MWKRPTRVNPGGGISWKAPRLPHEEDDPPVHSRYLELADVALGLKKPKPWKKKPVAPAHDDALNMRPFKKA